MDSGHPHSPELAALLGLFPAAALGRFEAVTAEHLPSVYRNLLAHTNHMTVTVERFYKEPVDVDVLEVNVNADRYARKILLRRQSDRHVVQFGIARLDFRFVSADVRRAVESQSVPLGRVLIEHGVLREIHLVQLWCVALGKDWRWFDRPAGQITYGRTALIDCDGAPAVELLEIVAPVG